MRLALLAPNPHPNYVIPIDQESFARLLPLALNWAKEQEEYVLARGAALGPHQSADAARVGVQDCGRVRMLVVDRMPVPENPELAEAAVRANIITTSCRGVAIGHAVLIRADCWQSRELIVHQLVHIAQCERAGGLQSFLKEYLNDRRTCENFTIGTHEEEARRIAREICEADAGQN